MLPPIPSFKIAGETQIKANIARSSLKNEFNITGDINSDEVAIKVIEAQKRGLKVVI